MISPSQRPLPDNTQHSQQTHIHAPGGIRTHDLSRRAAVDLRLRPRGHWDRLVVVVIVIIIIIIPVTTCLEIIPRDLLLFIVLKHSWWIQWAVDRVSEIPLPR